MKRTAIEKAIQQLEDEIAIRQHAIAALKAQAVNAPKRPRKSPPPLAAVAGEK